VSFTLLMNISLICSYIDSVDMGTVLNEFNVVPSALELITILQGTNSGCESSQCSWAYQSPPKYDEWLLQCESMDVRFVLGSFTSLKAWSAFKFIFCFDSNGGNKFFIYNTHDAVDMLLDNVKREHLKMWAACNTLICFCAETILVTSCSCHVFLS
jgi:hypothetical protein